MARARCPDKYYCPLATYKGVRILGLFPTLTTQVGGIQASGQVAWAGISDGGYRTIHRELGNASFCLYERGEQCREGARGGEMISAASKLGAVIGALRRRWPVHLVLVWHLSLSKLLPFFRVKDAKVVLFLHGIEAWKAQNRLVRTLLRRVDLFVSNSNYTWQHFLSFNPGFKEARHRTVHLGIGSPVDTPIPTPAHSPAVLMISRLLRSENYKGHREMIAAWPHVLKRVSDAELWIAGDGDLRQDLEEIARASGLDDRVRFWGQVSESEKQDLLMRCRCLALPSRGEGFGLVYLEAMRLGRPCLVSTLDAGCEVVKPPEAGLAADPRDPRALAEPICRLLTAGPEWNNWSLQARRRYESRFTAEQFQRRLLAALLET